MGMMDSSRTGFFNRVSDFEKGMLREALAQNGGNASEVARQLRISRSALHRKLRKYNLDTGLDDAPAPRSDTTPP
jgi:DNA-binding NtrC family response regulator